MVRDTFGKTGDRPMVRADRAAARIAGRDEGRIALGRAVVNGSVTTG
jgi:hypothetical protein